MTGISQINTAVGNLSDGTNQNASFASSMAAATRELEACAQRAVDAVRVFRIDATQDLVQDATALRKAARQKLAAQAQEAL